MTWSTRRLAELAGTTVNTVRHYHDRGLLDLPDRRTNGYKEYGVAHLVRLLEIRRLRDIGVPLSAIEQLGSGVGTSIDVLTSIDAELVETIERSRRARAEIAELVEHAPAGGVAAGFERVASRLSPAERSLTLIYAQLYDADAMSDVRAMLEDGSDDASAEFESLAPDADEATRADIAARFAASLAKALLEYPWLSAQEGRTSKSAATTQATVTQAMRELYSPAQLDVLGRASVLAQDLVARAADAQRSAPADGAGA